jgi:hypothetical protein
MDSPKKDNSNNSNDSNTSSKSISTNKEIKTFVLCVPADKKLDKKLVKYGTLKQISNIDLDEIIKTIENVQDHTNEIINNVNNINVNCNKCFYGMKCLTDNDIDAKAV